MDMIRRTPIQARSLHRPKESAKGKTVFAFDRDYTVGSNPPTEDDRPGVPIAWITHLAHSTEHLVYATGNQMLTSEAKIPGIPEIIDAHPKFDRDPSELEYDERPDRRECLRMLREIYPDAEGYVVVDDIDLSDMDGWTHYFSWHFVPRARQNEFPGLPPSTDEIKEIGPFMEPRTEKRLIFDKSDEESGQQSTS